MYMFFVALSASYLMVIILANNWEFLFFGGGGALQAVFFEAFFPNIFSGTGQKYVMCIQNIRLSKADVLNIHITYF